MRPNISTTSTGNPKFIISSNNNTGEQVLELAQKALNCITQEEIAPTQVSQAYQRAFKGNSSNTSRSKVYVAALVFKKSNGYFPESLEELTEHINQHSTENFAFDEIKLAAQYLTEIVGTDDYITDDDSTIYNLTALRNITEKTTESKLFHTTPVTQQTLNITRPNIKNQLNCLAERISTLNNTEDEEMIKQLENTISLEICTILEDIEGDLLSQKSTSARYKNLNELSYIIQKLNNPPKFMLNLCRDVNSPQFLQLAHLRSNMAFLLTKSIENTIRQIKTKDDSSLVDYLNKYIEAASSFISNSAETNLYNVLTSVCLQAQLDYPEGLHLSENNMRNILEQVAHQITQDDAPYLLRFLASAIENHNNSAITT